METIPGVQSFCCCNLSKNLRLPSIMVQLICQQLKEMYNSRNNPIISTSEYHNEITNVNVIKFLLFIIFDITLLYNKLLTRLSIFFSCRLIKLCGFANSSKSLGIECPAVGQRIPSMKTRQAYHQEQKINRDNQET